jgi:hypothetical protein
MLLQMDFQLSLNWKGRPAIFAAGPCVVKLNQCDQLVPRHHHLHLSVEVFLLGAFFGLRPHVITNIKLLRTYYAPHWLRPHGHTRAESRDYQFLLYKV